MPVYLPAFGAMTEEQVRELGSGTGFSRLLAARRVGAHSVMIIPLVARGVIMGIVALCRLADSRPFTTADLSLARDFVSRAAVPVDNARLYARERAAALTLQRGLLPRQIPEVPGLDLACRYVPAQTAAEVGGDWFDVIALPEGRCALTVGDVTGHDMRAASLMGQLRTATRTLATLGLAPAQILTRLDRSPPTSPTPKPAPPAFTPSVTPPPAAGTSPAPATPRPPWPAPATTPPTPTCPPACPSAPAWLTASATARTRPPACTHPTAAPCCCTPTGSSRGPVPTSAPE